jgi:hypothetical protein
MYDLQDAPPHLAIARAETGKFLDPFGALRIESDRLRAETVAGLHATAERQDLGESTARIAVGLKFTRPAAVRFPPVEPARGRG